VPQRRKFAQLPPFLGGGRCFETVRMQRSTYAAPPHRFEACTPSITQPVGLGAAVNYLSSIGMERIAVHEQAITDPQGARPGEPQSGGPGPGLSTTRRWRRAAVHRVHGRGQYQWPGPPEVITSVEVLDRIAAVHPVEPVAAARPGVRKRRDDTLSGGRSHLRVSVLRGKLDLVQSAHLTDEQPAVVRLWEVPPRARGWAGCPSRAGAGTSSPA
jgi:hypothetical protein